MARLSYRKAGSHAAVEINNLDPYRIVLATADVLVEVGVAMTPLIGARLALDIARFGRDDVFPGIRLHVAMTADEFEEAGIRQEDRELALRVR